MRPPDFHFVQTPATRAAGARPSAQRRGGGCLVQLWGCALLTLVPIVFFAAVALISLVAPIPFLAFINPLPSCQTI